MLQACNLYLNTSGGPGSYHRSSNNVRKRGKEHADTTENKEVSNSITDDNAGSGIISNNSRRDAGDGHILADGLRCIKRNRISEQSIYTYFNLCR